jgi:hypothetical protein
MSSVYKKPQIGQLIRDLDRRLKSMERNIGRNLIFSGGSVHIPGGLTIGGGGSEGGDGGSGTPISGGIPDVPTGFNATSSADAENVWVDLVWTFPDGPGAPTQFEVRWQRNGDTDYQYSVTSNSDAYQIYSLESNVLYNVGIRSISQLNAASAWVTDTVTSATDSVAPGTPTGLAVAANSTTAMLTWNDQSEADLNRYEVLGATSNTVDGNGKLTTGMLFGGTPREVTATVTTVDGLTTGTVADVANTYYWQIRAVDNAGNESAWTALVTATQTLLLSQYIATLTANKITAGTIGTEVLTLSNSANSRIESFDGTSLLIKGNGELVATAATITGAITATSGSFTGAITASSGTFGRITTVGDLHMEVNGANLDLKRVTSTGPVATTVAARLNQDASGLAILGYVSGTLGRNSTSDWIWLDTGSMKFNVATGGYTWLLATGITLMDLSYTSGLVLNGPVRANSGGTDGGLVMRGWTQDGSVSSLATNGMTLGEYAVLTDGTNVFLGSGAGGSTFVRGPSNGEVAQLSVSATAATFAGPLNVTGNLRANTGGVDGGLVLRGWTASSSYFTSLATNGMTGEEYCLLSNGLNTYVSAAVGGSLALRGGNNSYSNQIVVSGSAVTVTGVLTLAAISASEGGELHLAKGTGRTYPTVIDNAVDKMRVHDGATSRFELDMGTGVVRIKGNGVAYEGTMSGGGSRNHVGFSWGSPYIYGHVDGVVSAVIGTVSDRRLKEDIQPVVGSDSLAKVMAYRPVTYLPIDLDGAVAPGIGRHTGMIADEVELIDATLVDGVADNPDGYQSVNYAGVIPDLVQAFQGLVGRLDAAGL